MENENLEERVHQKDPIRLDWRGVKEDWLGRSIKGVRVEDRLDHDQALRQVFTEQTGSENKTKKCM